MLIVKYYHFQSTVGAANRCFFLYPLSKINFKNLEIYIQIQILSFFSKSEDLTKVGLEF